MIKKTELFMRICDLEDTVFELVQRIEKLEQKGKKKTK